MVGPTSEDILYLNVFTPVWKASSASGFAVLVFIHGGGYAIGSARKFGDIGICRNLCTKDVVVVTMQYRIGYLGFFSTGDEECPGNLALWDQLLALKWVKENISQFDGDPENITLMGHSSGACCVDLLSLSPYSRGTHEYCWYMVDYPKKCKNAVTINNEQAFRSHEHVGYTCWVPIGE
ncbi:hypothetical protein ANCCEY_07151 [Ancylostoma ceylanicum]|uniref:Carboxylesterase type B domain-containing protein n=1 Tax=Ancylostoma ceylanicum TaxID=53326 RepID=A0A0D6LPH1_9BILA|nr:hypothetical protein ANCCEY_07151 [Ancylostoma ceylanicum]